MPDIDIKECCVFHLQVSITIGNDPKLYPLYIPLPVIAMHKNSVPDDAQDLSIVGKILCDHAVQLVKLNVVAFIKKLRRQNTSNN